MAGFVLCSLPFTLFPLGEERVSSALAGIGNATTPLSAVLFTMLLLPADRVDRRTVLAVVAGFLGVVVILQPWESAGGPDAVGFGMTLLAGASYGLGWTYVKRFLAKDDIGGLGMPAAQLLMGAAQMLVVTLVWWLLHRDDGPSGIPAPWSLAPGSGPAVWPLVAVLVLGVVGTGLAFALQYDVVREVGPTVGATVTYVIPVVAVVLGMVFLHERLQWPQVLGAAVVLASAVTVGRARRRPVAVTEGEVDSSSWRSSTRRRRPGGSRADVAARWRQAGAGPVRSEAVGVVWTAPAPDAHCDSGAVAVDRCHVVCHVAVGVVMDPPTAT